jgi:hypothetical protein
VEFWIPASAGMTNLGGDCVSCFAVVCVGEFTDVFRLLRFAGNDVVGVAMM